MREMHELMAYHSRVTTQPVKFTRTELFNLMEKVWPYVSKSPLRNHFPTTAVWAQYLKKYNANNKHSSIVSSRQWRTEYEDGVGVQRQTTRWAVHLPPHHRGREDSQ
jgi:hypothetical protein